jgi:anthranilate/para-aminobenzoate synthase component I
VTSEEIKLLDDLGKIGIPVLGTVLGAVVGALSTFLVTRLNHRNEAAKDRARRRHELLVQCANDIAEFEHLIGTYATAVSNKVQGLEGGINLDDAREAVITKNHPLRRARMSLRLLGFAQASAQFEEYIELTREVIRRGPYLEKQRASELAKAIVRGPVKVYDALAAEFRSV